MKKKHVARLAKDKGLKASLRDSADQDFYCETLLEMANDYREEICDVICPADKILQVVEELSAINDPTEYDTIMSKVYQWFYEKCYQFK